MFGDSCEKDIGCIQCLLILALLVVIAYCFQDVLAILGELASEFVQILGGGYVP